MAEPETIGTLQAYERTAQDLRFTGLVNQAGVALSAAHLTTLTLGIYLMSTFETIIEPRSVLDDLTDGTLETSLLPSDLDLSDADIDSGTRAQERLLVITANRGLSSEAHFQWRLVVHAVAGARTPS